MEQDDDVSPANAAAPQQTSEAGRSPTDIEGGIPSREGSVRPGIIEAKVRSARAAQARWGAAPLRERVRSVRAFWGAIRKRRRDVLRVVREETGKPASEIETMELLSVELLVKFFTRNAGRVLGDREVPKPWILLNKSGRVRYVPRGLIGLITPFNYPVMLPAGDSIPALLGGNAVLVKPSEWTPKSAMLLESIALESGALPEGLFQVIAGGGETGEAVVRACDMVLFTGSNRVGRKVARLAAEAMKPCVLELGGKHPMIVCADAALSRAAKAAVWGGMANCGQTCVGVERVFVERAAYPSFVEAVLREISGLRQGPGSGYDVDMGRMVSPGNVARLLEQLDDARRKGARIIGAEIAGPASLSVPPTVVADATWDMRVMHEEIFGPVLPIMPVASAEEALDRANESPLGLSGSVWTLDRERAGRLGRDLQVGQLGVNDLMSHYAVAALPFGGFKESGLGHRHGEEGLRMFCRPQSIVTHRWPSGLPDPWWFPYSGLKTRLLSLLARLC